MKGKHAKVRFEFVTNQLICDLIGALIPIKSDLSMLYWSPIMYKHLLVISLEIRNLDVLQQPS